MTKKKSSKDAAVVSPEIPAISLPPPTINGSSEVKQSQVLSNSCEMDRIKDKLFKKKEPSWKAEQNSNQNFQNGAAAAATLIIDSTSSDELKSEMEIETNTKKSTSESNTNNSSSQSNTNNSTSQSNTNNSSSQIITSNSAAQSNTNNSSPQSITNNSSSQSNAKNSLENNSTMEFSKFQHTLTQIIQGRENPTRWKDDLLRSASTSEIRIDIDDEDQDQDDEVEEILGLDLEHENRKSSPDGHQKYQLYSSHNYYYQHQQLGSAGSSPNSIISPTSIHNVPSSCGGGVGLTSWDSIQLCSVQSCSKWASFKCKSCKNVSYCSEEHQKADWKGHKESCIPYKVTWTGGKRLIVAARNIPAGKLIFSQKPLFVFPIATVGPDLVHVLDLGCVINQNYLMTCEAKRPSCFGCMKSQDLLRHRCSKCGLPLCSPQCEYEISHQFGECSVLSSLTSRLTSDDLTTRCLHSLYMDVEILRSLHLRSTENSSDWEALLALRNHSRVLTYKNSARFKVFQANLTRLVPLSAKVVTSNDLDLISDLHAIVTSLSFRPSLQSSYKMLIPTQLEFGHDCIPNTIGYIENEATGRTLKIRCVVKAAVSIIKDEVINLDFLPTPYLSYTLRRKVLENLSINCDCRRCRNPSELGDRSGDIKCPNCDRGYVRAESPILWKDSVWSCSRCQEEVPYAQVTQIHKDWSSRLYNIPKTRAGLEKLVDFCNKAELRLNSNHELVIMAWCFIESIVRKDLEESRRHQFPDAYQDLSEKVLQDYRLLRQYCDVCDAHFKALRPGLWLDRGIMLLQRFFAHLAIASLAYQGNGLNRKDYANKVISYMKDLQEGASILAAYDGYSSSPSVQRITQDTTWALAKTKEFIEKFLKCDPFPTNKSIQYPLPI